MALSWYATMRGLLAITQGVSHAASWALLADSINDDFDFKYSQMMVMVASAVVGGLLEAVSTYCFEGAFIGGDGSDDTRPASELLLPDGRRSEKECLEVVGIVLFTTARFTDILIGSVASYAACTGVFSGDANNRSLAALSLAKYLAIAGYALLINCSFSFLTEISAQFDLQFKWTLSSSQEKVLRSIFTFTHILDHATNQIPLLGHGMKGQAGPLSVLMIAGVTIFNLPIAGTTYLFETRELSEHLTGHSQYVRIPSLFLAQFLYATVPVLSALLHGAEAVMPLVLLAEELKGSYKIAAIPIGVFTGLSVAVGNWLTEGKEAKDEILKGVRRDSDSHDIKEGCLFLSIKAKSTVSDFVESPMLGCFV
jgi:hypothetical protein